MAELLKEQASLFIDQITQKLEDNHKKVESLIKDKESNLAKLEQFVKTLTSAKTRIMEADK